MYKINIIREKAVDNNVIDDRIICY